MARQVLSMNGQVQLIDARGHRRQLRVGERVARGERLELADGAELILRHDDGREERLQGPPLPMDRGESADRLDTWLVLPDTDVPLQHPVRQSRAAPQLRLFDQARPEAGLLPGGGETGGHGFIRVERVQFLTPRTRFDMVTAIAPPSTAEEKSALVSQLDFWFQSPKPIPLVAFSDDGSPLVAYLREGGSEVVNDERTQVTSEILLTSALLLDENGVPLSAGKALVLRQTFSMVTISLQAEAEGLFRWQVIRQTLDYLDQMPEIPFGTSVTERYTLTLQGGGALTLINQIEGAEDFLEDEVIEIEEWEDFSSSHAFSAFGASSEPLSDQLLHSSQDQLEKMGISGSSQTNPEWA